MKKNKKGNVPTAFEMVNRFGTYEIQRTADTENDFPTIAQGLSKDYPRKLAREIKKEK